jgi:hypothetical protein
MRRCCGSGSERAVRSFSSLLFCALITLGRLRHYFTCAITGIFGESLKKAFRKLNTLMWDNSLWHLSSTKLRSSLKVSVLLEPLMLLARLWCTLLQLAQKVFWKECVVYRLICATAKGNLPELRSILAKLRVQFNRMASVNSSFFEMLNLRWHVPDK